MTPEQVALIEQTSAALQPGFERVAEDLLGRLEHRAPQGDPEHPTVALVRGLLAVAATIGHHDRFVAEARALTRRSADDAPAAHRLRSLQPLVLSSLAVSLADRWTPEVADAWRLAYNLTTSAMAVRP
jgi:hypothetical protein